MNFGALRHRIQIQNKTDGTGGSTGTSGTGSCADVNPFDDTTDGSGGWTTFYECFTDLQALTAKEVSDFNQVNMKVSHKLVIRYPGPTVPISAGNQILYLHQGSTRTFQLQTGLINVDERDVELDLLAFEIDPTL